MIIWQHQCVKPKSIQVFGPSQTDFLLQDKFSFYLLEEPVKASNQQELRTEYQPVGLHYEHGIIVRARKFTSASYTHPFTAAKNYCDTVDLLGSLHLKILPLFVFSCYLSQPNWFIKLHQPCFQCVFSREQLYAEISTQCGAPWGNYLHQNPPSFPVLYFPSTMKARLCTK